MNDLKETVSKIVNESCGTPSELKRRLNNKGLRYVVTRKGCAVRYIVRGNNFKTIVKL